MNRYVFPKTSSIITVLLILFLAAAGHSASAASQKSVTSYELIAGVNQLRVDNGLPELAAANLLMISAQSHSEYQASLGYWTHEGPGGSNETDRAIAVGYGNGAQVSCDEAVAIASDIKDIDYIIYDLWDDYDHRNLVLLNSRYVEIGSGVAQGGDGLFYYTVDLCVISGQVPGSTPTTSQGSGSTPTYQPIATQPPREDGSIWHTVQLGETLFDIALAYNITVLDLATMNGISPSNPLIYEGDVLLIKGAPPATPTATITNTPKPPTRTPRPTFTASPTRPTSTASITPTITPTPKEPSAILTALDSIEKRQWGILILVISVLGLAGILIFNPNKTQDQLESADPAEIEEVEESNDAPNLPSQEEQKKD
ncbi:MAG: LysM peptidoglycan-binding domain-containing protein [Anaerolineaceae bacterium]|nr:LysM peptidoglycan-binding domain-containing protein [Anaerolineaceae bacterium]